jgi:hypothetical protein
VGCGSLLTDFEILCGLVEKGFGIESICVVDKIYQASSLELFRALSSFFPSARVVAFVSLHELKEAATVKPNEHGRVTTFLQIDSNDLSTVTSHSLAARLLVEGGHAFELKNVGARRSSNSCRRRSSNKPLPPEGSGDVRWMELLEAVELEASEGCETPLGIAESPESMARPLWDRAEAGGESQCAPSKGANFDEAGLEAALNLL